MKIEFEIPDDKFAKCVADSIRDGGHWYGAVREQVTKAAHEQVLRLPIEDMVKKFIAEKVESIMDDVVYKQLRHVVKLAVDKELGIARVATEEAAP